MIRPVGGGKGHASQLHPYHGSLLSSASELPSGWCVLREATESTTLAHEITGSMKVLPGLDRLHLDLPLAAVCQQITSTTKQMVASIVEFCVSARPRFW